MFEHNSIVCLLQDTQILDTYDLQLMCTQHKNI